MFPFSKPKPTRAELLKQSVAGGVNTLLEYVPAEKIETVTYKAKDLAQHAGGIASEKLHIATDVMSHTLHDVADRVREASAHAADVAPDKFAAGADLARERAVALRGTATVVGGKLAEQAVDRAHQAADTAAVLAQAAREQAQAKLQAARERAAARAEEARLAALEAAEEYRDAASEAAEDARDRWTAKAADKREEFMESAADARDRLAAKAAAKRDELAASAAETRDDLADKADETKTNLLLSAAGLFADWKGRAAEAADDIELPQLRHEPEAIEIKEGNSKLLWILAGVAVGAIVLLFVLPASRRRAKSMVKDRVKQLKDGAADAATVASDKAHDLRNRAEGLAHTLDKKLHSDVLDENDATLADRVRSELGHLEIIQDLERLNINAEFGTVTLRGPVLDAETQAALEKAVRAIPGVKEVKSDFLVEDAEPADASTYAQ